MDGSDDNQSGPSAYGVAAVLCGAVVMDTDRIRAAIHALCAAIDNGDVTIASLDDEEDLVRFAAIASACGLHDEVHMLAARSKYGRDELKKWAQ